MSVTNGTCRTGPDTALSAGSHLALGLLQRGRDRPDLAALSCSCGPRGINLAATLIIRPANAVQSTAEMLHVQGSAAISLRRACKSYNSADIKSRSWHSGSIISQNISAPVLIRFRS